MNSQTIQFYLDGACSTPAGDPVSLSSSVAEAELPFAFEGSYSYRVTATDGEGLSVPLPCSSAMVIDRTPPTVSISRVSDAVSTDGTAVYQFRFSEALDATGLVVSALENAGTLGTLSWTVTASDSDPTLYTVSATNSGASDGTVLPRLKSASVADLAGNSNVESTTSVDKTYLPLPSTSPSPTAAPTDTPTPTPSPVPTATPVVQVSGAATAVFGTTNGFTMDLNVVADDSLFPDDTNSELTNVSQVTRGGTHTCALDSAGAIYCWGDNSAGQLGLGAAGGSGVSTPTRLMLFYDSIGTPEPDNQFSKIVASGNHTCAIRSVPATEVWCWGDGNNAEVVPFTNNTFDTPQLVVTDSGGAGDPYDDIALGLNHTCAHNAANSSMWCWGSNARGQLSGDASFGTWSYVQNYPFSKIYAGGNVTCGYHTGMTDLICWGENSLGQLGLGNTTPNPYDVASNIVGFYISIGIGYGHSCATVYWQPYVYCWGDNSEHQLGVTGVPGWTSTQTQVAFPIPTPSPSGTPIAMVAMGATHSLALVDQQIYGWGVNDQGQLAGAGASYVATTPMLLPRADTSTKYTFIAAGESGSCAITDSGALDCWGNNAAGQLGIGISASTAISTNTKFSRPMRVKLAAPYCQVTEVMPTGTDTIENARCECTKDATLGNHCKLKFDSLNTGEAKVKIHVTDSNRQNGKDATITINVQ